MNTISEELMLIIEGYKDSSSTHIGHLFWSEQFKKIDDFSMME